MQLRYPWSAPPVPGASCRCLSSIATSPRAPRRAKHGCYTPLAKDGSQPGCSGYVVRIKALLNKTARHVMAKGYAFAAFTGMHGGVPVRDE
jgi:hypothetical protein